MSALTTINDAPPSKEARRVFLRLSGDVTRELNAACLRRIDEGETQASLARAAGQDPAFLSRILSGVSGTNLRTIAAVLAATRHRLKLVAVPMEDLIAEAEAKRAMLTGRWRNDPAIQMRKTVQGNWIVMGSIESYSPRNFTSHAAQVNIEIAVEVE